MECKGRKGISVLVMMCMVLALLGGLVSPAQAEEPVVWDGTVASGFAGGWGMEDDPFQIATAEQLAFLMQAVNTNNIYYMDKHYKLTADIVLNDETFTFDSNTGLVQVTDGINTAYLGTGIKGKLRFDTTASVAGRWYSNAEDTEGYGSYPSGNLRNWTPIGRYVDATTTYCFTGSFDGNGHTVSGVYINNDSDYQGLFGIIGVGGVVKDLGVINSYISTSTLNVGGVAGHNIGTVTGCYNNGAVGRNGVVGHNIGTVTGCYNKGAVANSGVVGHNIGTVTECYNEGNVTSTSRYTFTTGGVVGSNYDSGTVTDCYNKGDVTSTISNVGGVVGSNSGTVTDCYNKGDVTGANDGIGGVVGQNDTVGTVRNCYTTAGTVSGGSDEIGGVVGINNGTVTDCYNSCAVSGVSNVGGVVGQNNDSGTVTNCFNTSAVTSSGNFSNNFGGVVGYNSGTVTDCYNEGDVTGAGNSDSYIGGVAGYNKSGTVTNCFNTGAVTCSGTYSEYIGGVAGFNTSGTVTNCFNTGGVTGAGTYSQHIGGVAGQSYCSTVTNCYNAGAVEYSGSGSCSSIGGVAGYIGGYGDNPGAVTNCYWLKRSLEQGVGSCPDSSFLISLGSFDNVADDLTASDGTTLEYDGTLLNALNAWVTANQTTPASYSSWVAGTSYPTFHTYTLTVSANLTTGGTVTGGGTFNENTSRTVTATANSDYEFVRWTEGDNEVSTSASYTFDLTADRNLVAEFNYTVTPTITFITHPQPTTVTEGSITESLTAAATVSPSGTATLAWYACTLEGNIYGESLATGSTFYIPTTLTAGSYYRYRCRATYSGATTVDSDIAYVTVNAAPVTPTSTTPTADVTSVSKTEATQPSVDFTLTNSPALTGTWKVYENASVNATHSTVTVGVSGDTLTLTHASDIPAATYYVSVTEAGKAESARLALTVTSSGSGGGGDTPTIAFTTQPQNKTVTAGSITANDTLTAAASVTPASAATPTLNWYACDSNGVISGNSLGMGSPFAIPTTLAQGTYHYLCQATIGTTASANSSVATVTVNAAPVTPTTPNITTVPTASAITYGQTLNDSTLSNGVASVAGTFAWQDTSTAPQVSNSGITEYNVVFTPTDTANYTNAICEVKLTVNAKDLTDVAISAITDQEYTGNAIKPEPTVTSSETIDSYVLVKDTDYTVTYGTNIDVGANTGIVTVTAKSGSNYTFTPAITKSFNIVAQAGNVSISGDLNTTYGTTVPDVMIDKHGSDGTTTVYYYTDSACTQGETTVKPTAAGNYWVRVSMAAGSNHGFAVSNIIAFTIAQKSISSATIGSSSLVYNGSAQTPTVTVTIGGLAATGSWSNVTNVGDASTFTASGNFTGTVQSTTLLAAKSLAAATFTTISAEPYTGSAIKPTPTVTLDAIGLTAGTDFDYSYNNNTYVGTATVNITGKGNYTGSATNGEDFNITAVEDPAVITPTATVTMGGNTVHLSHQVSGAKGTVSYTKKSGEGSVDVNGNYISPNATGTAMVTVTIADTNVDNSGAVEYTGKTADITITITAKDTQFFASGFSAARTMTYGDTDSAPRTALLTTGNGTITYSSGDTTVAEVNSATGVLTIKKPGTTVITATAAETADYAEASVSYTLTVAQREVQIAWANNTSRVYGDGKTVTAAIGNKVGADDVSLNVAGGNQTNAGGPYTATASLVGAKAGCYKLPATVTITYTITKATPTGEPAYTAITTAGKTLADAALAIGTITPAGGTIAWNSTTATVVVANTAYDWTYTPVDTANYEVLTNTITPYVVSDTGGGRTTGGGSSPTTTAPVTSAPVTAGDTSTVTTEVKATVSGTTASATVPADAANAAVDNAIQAAQASNTVPAVQISVDVPAAADSVAVTIPAAALETLSGNDDAALTIASDVGNITLDSDALAAIVDSAGANITVSIAPVDTARLTEEQQEAVGDAPVYDIAITSGSRSISDLGGGKAWVSVPYELPEGQDPKAVVVYYLDDAGNLNECETVYDPTTKTVSFVTEHFSKYVIGYDETLLWENPFADVSERDWFYDGVRTVVQAGLFEGTGATTFAPQTAMTRAMFVTVLWRLEGEPAAAVAAGFDDVAAGTWYADAVAWAAANDIVNGTSDTTFSPDAVVTREQMATILYRYNNGASGIAVAYTDAADISAWAAEGVAWASAQKLFQGYPDGTFKPRNSATRAEVATVFARLL